MNSKWKLQWFGGKYHVKMIEVDEARRLKKKCIIFKVDYEKAYSSINGEFLFYMLRRLDFYERWVGWIKACLSSSSILVLVNGSSTSKFKVLRGLRKGNPLALFLFNVVVEGLSGMMRQTIKKGIYKRFSVCKLEVGVNLL